MSLQVNCISLSQQYNSPESQKSNGTALQQLHRNTWNTYVYFFARADYIDLTHHIKPNLPINGSEKLYILFICEIKPENKKNSDKTSISQT